MIGLGATKIRYPFAYSEASFPSMKFGGSVRDNLYTGSGFIAGISPGIVTKNNLPLKCKILLYERGTGKLIRETWSKEDGTYIFDNLNIDLEYDLVARDPSKVYSDAIVSGIKPQSSSFYIQGMVSRIASGTSYDGTYIIRGGFPPYKITFSPTLNGSYSIVNNTLKLSINSLDEDTTQTLTDSKDRSVSGLIIGAELWTPAHLAVAPKIWLDHTSPITDVSGYASEWYNEGTIGGSFSQANPSYCPQILTGELNGKRVLRFDGTNDWMRMTSTAAGDLYRNTGIGWSFYVAKKRGTDTSASRILMYAPNNIGASRFNVGVGGTSPNQNKTIFSTRRLDSHSTTAKSGSVSVGSYAIRRTVMDWSANMLADVMDGIANISGSVATGTGSTSNTASNYTNVDIAADGGDGARGSGYADLDFAALLAGSGSAPSTAEWQRIEGYYADAYALQANLPSDHPFRYVPPYVNTPELQPSFASDPVVIGFVAATDSGNIGLAAGPAVATAFGTLLNSEPSLATGEGIEVIYSGTDVTVTLTGLSLSATPTQAVLLDHKGNTLATIALTDGGGYYVGTASIALSSGSVYYVSI